MCVTLAVASMGMSAIGGIAGAKAQQKQGQAALNQAYYDAEMQEMQAEDIKRKSIDDANVILRQAASMRSAQTAQQSVSGMVVNSGSAQTVLDETTKLSTADALVTLYNGVDGFVTGNSQAQNTITAGKNEAEAYASKATSTLLSGFMSAGQTGMANYSAISKALTTKK